MSEAVSKIDSVSTESAVVRAATVLRQISIGAGEDQFLGSEETLAEKLGVSAPTLRQASRILEFEQLLRIKRGNAGGYYVRRPSIDVAVSTAGTYLAAHNVDARDGFEVTRALSELLMRGAALCRDPGLRADLEFFREYSPLPPVEEWEREQSFIDLLARMAGNEALRLVLLIFNFSGTTLVDLDLPVDPVQAETYLRLRTDLIEAVLDGDYELAASIGQERLALMRRMLLPQGLRSPRHRG